MLKRRKNPVPPPPQTCDISECLSIIGGTWTPNIIWYLASRPRRFSELASDLQGISPKVLTQRLRKLESKGVVSRAVLATSPPSVEYTLTATGKELVQPIEAIVAIGRRLKDDKPLT